MTDLPAALAMAERYEKAGMPGVARVIRELVASIKFTSRQGHVP
jgi:hypothetical protein